MTTAETILSQLGGRHFTTMVGARQLCVINNGTGLQLDFMKNPSKANRLRVIYDAGTDTYTIQFLKRGVKTDYYTMLNKLADRLMKKHSCTFHELETNHSDEFAEAFAIAQAKAKAKAEPTIIKEVSECYCDDLRRIFETTTKLRTSLTRIYGE